MALIATSFKQGENLTLETHRGSRCQRGQQEESEDAGRDAQPLSEHAICSRVSRRKRVRDVASSDGNPDSNLLSEEIVRCRRVEIRFRMLEAGMQPFGIQAQYPFLDRFLFRIHIA